ncbi:hypothetical protein LCGC14_2952110, partial [marine sediment metagenome]
MSQEHGFETVPFFMRGLYDNIDQKLIDSLMKHTSILGGQLI